MIAAVLVLCGIAYSILAIAALLKFQPGSNPPSNFSPPVSILKPVRGRDEDFCEAIRSHARLDYPEFEILFGISLANDAALEDITRLQNEFPSIPIRVVSTFNDAPNGKAGSLDILARAARFDTLVVNDSDILVHRDYLRRVVQPLQDRRIGLVTCLYRAKASSWAANLEALGVATEFAPSVLVSRLLSHSAFALGSTMAFRRADLHAVGGFAAIRNYLADDYQLGLRISAAGKKVALADTVVETSLGSAPLRQVWRHQVRWSRTIRVSRPAGYAGYILTQVTCWSFVALAAGYFYFGVAGISIRLIAALLALRRIDPARVRMFLLVPARDLFGVAVWLAGLGGTKVEWRGIRFRLHRDGTIEPLQ